MDVMRLYPGRVELNAAFDVSTAILRAATWKRGMIHLALNASQAAATRLWLAEALTITSAVLPGDPQVVQLPFLLLLDLLNPGSFEECIAAFRWVRLKEGTFVQVCPADVDVLLWDVVNC